MGNVNLENIQFRNTSFPPIFSKNFQNHSISWKQFFPIFSNIFQDTSLIFWRQMRQERTRAGLAGSRKGHRINAPFLTCQTSACTYFRSLGGKIQGFFSSKTCFWRKKSKFSNDFPTLENWREKI